MDRPARGWALGDRVVGALLVALVAVPIAYLPLGVVDPLRATATFWLVAMGWVVVAAIAATTPLAPLLGRHPALLGLALALVGWVWTSSALAYQPAAAWRYAAVVTTGVALALALLAWLDGRPDRRRFLVRLVVGAVAAQLAIAALQAARITLLPLAPGAGPLEDWIRVVETGAMRGAPLGTLGHVNYLSEWLALTAPVAVAWVLGLGGARRWAALPIGAAALWVLGVADTRAVMLGSAIGGPAAAWLVWRDRRGVRRASAGLLAVALAMTGVAAWRWLHHLNTEVAVALRLANWRAAWDLVVAHPIAGVGLGGFKLLSNEALERVYPVGIPMHGAVERLLQVHNEPLQLLAELGVVGAAIALALLAVWLRTAARNDAWPPAMRFGLVGGVAALAVASCFGFPLHVPLTALMLILVLALGAATGGAAPPGRAERGRWIAAVALALVGAAVVGFDAWPEYRAHRVAHEAARHRRLGDWPAAEAAYRQADAGLRFKGRNRWFWLEALVHQGQFGEAIALADASAKDGLGLDAAYWRGMALEGLGRPAEARAAYARMTRFFPANHPLHQAAAARLQGLDGGASK